MKARPLLGYGPENFSIAFDKYYDPSLPGITKQPGGGISSWWDRAHNFIFDISVSAGIPALIIFLSLIGVLFYQLQKLKYNPNSTNEYPNAPNKYPDPIIAHGIQATFIGYLVANFFAFDTFSTYLIFFSIIAFSLYIVSKNSEEKTFRLNIPGRYVLISILFILLIWFVWVFNIKPLQINKELNWADFYGRPGKFEKAEPFIEKARASHGILDHYVNLIYTDIINTYFRKADPEKKIELSQKAIGILKENIEIRPYYTRNWLHLASHSYYLATKNKDDEDLRKETSEYFKKLGELSPNRIEVILDWTRFDLFAGNCEAAKERTQKCIDFIPEKTDCWWLLSLTQFCLGESEDAKDSIEVVKNKGYPIDSKGSLLEMANVNIYAKNHQELEKIYKKLIEIEPKNYKFHVSLACVYKELENYTGARKEATLAIQLSSEWKGSIEKLTATVEAFLKSDEVCK